MGVSDNQNGTADFLNGVWIPVSMGIPEIAVFTFDDVNLQSTANTTVTGTRALGILSHGNAGCHCWLAQQCESPVRFAT